MNERRILSLAIGSQQTAHDLWNQHNTDVLAHNYSTTAQVAELYQRRRAAHALYMDSVRATNVAADRFVAAKAGMTAA